MSLARDRTAVRAAALACGLAIVGCSLTELDDLASGRGGAAPAGGGGSGEAGGAVSAAAGGAAGSGGETSAGGRGGSADCCEPLPAGWSGPVTSTYGPLDPGLTCSQGEEPTTMFAGPLGTIQCTDCSCGALGNATCAPPTLECGIGDCGGPLDVDACTSISMPNAHCKVMGSATLSNPGSCPASQVMETKATWSGQYSLCPVDDDCATRSACPRSGLCIHAPDHTLCPAGWDDRSEVWSGADDTLQCTACSCIPTGVTCTDGVYKTYPSAGCGSGGTVVSASCSAIPAGDDYAELDPKPTASGGCTPQGGAETGAFTPTGPVTICCRP